MTAAAPEGAVTFRLPWTFSAFSRFMLVQLLALVAILVCFAGAHHTKVWDDQLYWLVGAIAALLVAAGSWIVWLANGARGLRIRQHAVDVAIAPLSERFATAPASGVASDALVSSADMRRYHRADCALVGMKPVVEVTEAAVVAAGKQPCGVCLP